MNWLIPEGKKLVTFRHSELNRNTVLMLREEGKGHVRKDEAVFLGGSGPGFCLQGGYRMVLCFQQVSFSLYALFLTEQI